VIILVKWNVFSFIRNTVNQIDNQIDKLLKQLPTESGVYQFYDNKRIIYIGKAKNLRKRVLSYFTKDQTGKTKVLISKIRDIKFIITKSEQDALLLENSLIKKYKPVYNILLKDDKTYPWVCISNESFPRVFSTRKVIKDGSQYFGPYTSVKMVNTLLKLFKELFQLRDCNLNLSEENIKTSGFKVCLEYHIGNCKGPCIGEESEYDYLLKINQIKNILNGNLSKVQKYLKGQMDFYASNLDFENAQLIKNSLSLLNEYQSKSTVVSYKITNIDVFGIYNSDNQYFVNYFKVVNGAIIQSHNAELKVKFKESPEDVLMHYIISLRDEFHSQSKEVLIPFKLKSNPLNVRMIVPVKGQKKELVDLSFRNAKFYGLEILKSKTIKSKSSNSSLIELQSKLRLNTLPLHIECFDNSNIQGEFPVSACIVFKNGLPSKKDYRIFNIKRVQGPNDYASMQEVIERRYSRILREKGLLPNLIIIDGGKGQLNSALSALNKIGLKGKIAVIGIAKRLEEIFFPGDPFPMYIDKRSSALKLIQFCRNEAHRFSINHHRNRRSKKIFDSELNAIKGIGDKTITSLLVKFKTVQKIKKASLEELTNEIGEHKAKILIAYFSK